MKSTLAAYNSSMSDAFKKPQLLGFIIAAYPANKVCITPDSRTRIRKTNAKELKANAKALKGEREGIEKRGGK
jgi:hypothetical protein